MAKKIVVIGDVMLDKYDYCSQAENPEGPIPCGTVEETKYLPGGAGNVAANLASLGANLELISVIGDDFSSGILENQLNLFNIPSKLIRDCGRQTIVKERIFVDNRYICRVNREKKRYIDENHVREIVSSVSDADLILISDYRKGMISENLMQTLKQKGIPIVVDPKPEHINFYEGVFLIKPNLKEATLMTGIEDGILAGETLMNKLQANILLTLGERGISYFGLDGKRYNFPAEKRTVADVTGAGDTAIATFCHFLVKEDSLEDCINYSNKAAGISVEHSGCYHVTEKEIFENN
jgi:D-beta-D-heptose 7-phosphate kinase/D-beta-D-heptose 1-phosphate adenosyltransferase